MNAFLVVCFSVPILWTAALGQTNATAPTGHDHSDQPAPNITLSANQTAEILSQQEVKPLTFLQDIEIGFGARASFGQSNAGSRTVVQDITQGIFSPITQLHGPVYCPEGFWVNGVSQRVEKSQKTRDDTALNAVRLTCAPLGKYEQHYQFVTPHEGQWGDWHGTAYCKDGIVNGFNLRLEGLNPKTDNTAANGLQIECSNGQIISLDGSQPNGQWQGQTKCKAGSAVCGMSSFFQRVPYVSIGVPFDPKDDVGMLGLTMHCCEFAPVPNCTPDDKWETVVQCTNDGRANNSHSCRYKETVGITESNSHMEGGSTESTITAKLTIELGGKFKGVQNKFTTELGTSQKTGHNWSTTSSKTFEKRSEMEMSFTVPLGECLRLEQVVGACGSTKAYASVTRLVKCN